MNRNPEHRPRLPESNSRHRRAVGLLAVALLAHPLAVGTNQAGGADCSKATTYSGIHINECNEHYTFVPDNPDTFDPKKPYATVNKGRWILNSGQSGPDTQTTRGSTTSQGGHTTDGACRRPIQPYERVYVRMGDCGPGVGAIQEALGVPVDGVFGEETCNALKQLSFRTCVLLMSRAVERIAEKRAQPVQQPNPVTTESRQSSLPKRSTTPEENLKLARSMGEKTFDSPEEGDCLKDLADKESSGKTDALNPKTFAWGIGQSNPSVHDKKAIIKQYGIGILSSARLQLAWMIEYIKGRHGTACKALDFWKNVAPTYDFDNDGRPDGNNWY